MCFDGSEKTATNKADFVFMLPTEEGEGKVCNKVIK